MTFAAANPVESGAKAVSHPAVRHGYPHRYPQENPINSESCPQKSAPFRHKFVARCPGKDEAEFIIGIARFRWDAEGPPGQVRMGRATVRFETTLGMQAGQDRFIRSGTAGAVSAGSMRVRGARKQTADRCGGPKGTRQQGTARFSSERGSWQQGSQSGRRQGGCQSPMQRPRRSTWRLYLWQGQSRTGPRHSAGPAVRVATASFAPVAAG